LRELAPYEIRGSITGRNELAIVLGQFLAFVVNAILGNTLGHIEGVWRIMFGICALPAIALSSACCDARVAALARREGPL
jgi:MFS family permease